MKAISLSGILGCVAVSGLLSACSAPDSAQTHKDSQTQKNLQTAEALIDAFYSFDAQQLEPFLRDAPDSAPALTYYQGWAEGGNYKVLQRSACVAESAERVSCAITVEDDPVLALGTDFKVTDTFTISFRETVVSAVENSSNDQPIYYEAYHWVAENMPEVMSGPCQGFFEAGPTPGDCARAMTAGYRAFAGQTK